MRKLNDEDILKNRIDTIPQYYILNYLKNNLNIDRFKVFIVNSDTMKVIDDKDDYLYFKYDDNLKEVVYSEELKNVSKEMEL